MEGRKGMEGRRDDRKEEVGEEMDEFWACWEETEMGLNGRMDKWVNRVELSEGEWEEMQVEIIKGGLDI